MLTAEADIQTEHAATYLARICGHAGKMGAAGHRLGHRRPSHARGDGPPEVRHTECSENEGTVSLNWGQWTMRAFPGLLAVRAEAADEQSLQRIQDLLTARLQKFGRREQLTVTCPPESRAPRWRPPASRSKSPRTARHNRKKLPSRTCWQPRTAPEGSQLPGLSPVIDVFVRITVPPN